VILLIKTRHNTMVFIGPKAPNLPSCLGDMYAKSPCFWGAHPGACHVRVVAVVLWDLFSFHILMKKRTKKTRAKQGIDQTSCSFVIERV
jgi:hypothetical protein